MIHIGLETKPNLSLSWAIKADGPNQQLRVITVISDYYQQKTGVQIY